MDRIEIAKKKIGVDELVCPICGGKDFVLDVAAGMTEPLKDWLDPDAPLGYLTEIQCEECWTTFCGFDSDDLISIAIAVRKIMGKSQREKGKRGEREVKDILRKRGWSEARRGQQYAGSPDSPDVIGIPGIHFEIKRVERLDLGAAIKQSKDDSADNEVPVVAHRKSGEPWYVTLSLEDFLMYVQATQMASHEGCDCWPYANKEWVGR